MSDEKGPVHYQISITATQAGGFFLALLVALGLSFFFGMKTGAAARRAPDAARLAAVQDAAVPKEAAREGEAPGVSSPPEEEPTLGVPEPTEAPERKKPRPEPTEAPAPTPPPKPTPAAHQDAGGPFYVQVVATQSAAAADELSRKLRAGGFSSDVSPVTPEGKPQLFRVRVGPFRDRAEADAAAGRVQTAEKLKTRPIVVPAGK